MEVNVSQRCFGFGKSSCSPTSENLCNRGIPTPFRTLIDTSVSGLNVTKASYNGTKNLIEKNFERLLEALPEVASIRTQ